MSEGSRKMTPNFELRKPVPADGADTRATAGPGIAVPSKKRGILITCHDIYRRLNQSLGIFENVMEFVR
jgi:hypothetical protein